MKEKKRQGKSLGAMGSAKEMLSHKQGKYEVIFNFGWVRGESPETVPAASINWVVLTKGNRQGREKHNHC